METKPLKCLKPIVDEYANQQFQKDEKQLKQINKKLKELKE